MSFARWQEARNSRYARLWLIWIAASLAALLAAVAFLVWHQANSPTVRIPLRVPSPSPTAIPTLPEQRNLEVAPEKAREINEARPFERGPVLKAVPFSAEFDPLSEERAVGCLAAAAWYEAGDDPEGEKAVVQTVLNRVRHPAFPSTVCGVVFQGQERVTGCQFTFTCDGALQRIPSDAAWKRAVAIGKAMLHGEVYAPIGYSTHYHTDWVVPYWSPTLAKVAKVHTHIFYRWPGYWGTRPAFRQTAQGVEPIIPAIAHLSEAHALLADASQPAAEPAALPAPAAYAEKPVLQMPGISQRSMHGSTVRLAPQPNTFFLKLEDRAFAGNYAISALAVCKNKPTCQVYGWADGASIADHLPLTESQRAKLVFYYVRGADSLDKALWNCALVPRNNPSQCMPGGSLPGAQ